MWYYEKQVLSENLSRFFQDVVGINKMGSLTINAWTLNAITQNSFHHYISRRIHFFI